MSGSKKILKADLNEPQVVAWIEHIARGVIRRCFLTFLPVLLLIGAGIISTTVYYLEDIKKTGIETAKIVSRLEITVGVMKIQDKDR